jgi:predicted dithiol-disulfide oxidoreductase (DUF899 family)
MQTIETMITGQKVVSLGEWIAARKDLLTKEKESTRLRDQLSAERRKLPWVKVGKQYVFDGPDGKQTLADLFAGRSQLVIYQDHLGFTMEWVRHHDRYGTDEFADANKPYWPATASPSSTTHSCGSTEAHS